MAEFDVSIPVRITGAEITVEGIDPESFKELSSMASIGSQTTIIGGSSMTEKPKHPSIKEIVDVCERYGAKPTQVTSGESSWASDMQLQLKVPGITISLTAKSLDELESRLRLLAPLFAEAALAKKE
jgi:hypothetical protein